MTQATNARVAVPGGRLHVVDDESRTDAPLLLLHAGIADLRSWDALTPLLIGAGYRVVRFDARGAGRTESEPVPYSSVGGALAVLDALDMERAVLVGNSRRTPRMPGPSSGRTSRT